MIGTSRAQERVFNTEPFFFTSLIARPHSQTSIPAPYACRFPSPRLPSKSPVILLRRFPSLAPRLSPSPSQPPLTLLCACMCLIPRPPPISPLLLQARAVIITCSCITPSCEGNAGWNFCSWATGMGESQDETNDIKTDI